MPLKGLVPKIVTVLLKPGVRYAMAWLLLIVVAVGSFYYAWTIFDTPRELQQPGRRPGGNAGHTLVDFGGQWLIGGMVAHGWGRHLYHRDYELDLLRQGYPREEEVPAEAWPKDKEFQHEAERLLSWLIEIDNPEVVGARAAFLVPFAFTDPIGRLSVTAAVLADADMLVKEANAPIVGGPLYPPIHGLLMSPLGALKPSLAYRVMQMLGMTFAFLCGWGIRTLAAGRVWWPIATTSVILYPGFISMLDLGQNSIFLLTPLVWGWVFLRKGRPLLGGLAWAMLAFKPVWFVAFFLVPFLTGRVRFCFGMFIGAAALSLATLPLVGWHSWVDWLQIGREASHTYGLDQNWIFLSRDLLNLPRRWLFDFPGPPSADEELVAHLVGFAMLLAVFEITVRLTVMRGNQRTETAGPMAAFLLLGAWFCCYHFMYYDVLLTALPVWLLLLDKSRSRYPRLAIIHDSPGSMPLIDVPAYYGPRWPTVYPAYLLPGNLPSPPRAWALNSLTLTLIALFVLSDLLGPGLGISFSIAAAVLEDFPLHLPLKFSTSVGGTPWSVFFLLALWLWTAWRVAHSNREADSQRSASSKLV